LLTLSQEAFLDALERGAASFKGADLDGEQCRELRALQVVWCDPWLAEGV